MRILIIILSLFFVLFSFSPSLYEIYNAKNLPSERTFVLEHNYLFDYNFYLSRIHEGQEGKWTVVEKYYNQPHQGSLFQVFYLLLGKLGGLGGLTPQVVYHLARLVMGLMLLILIGRYIGRFFRGKWQIVTFLFIVTAGSWPILVKAGDFYRFATYMGWWSVIDSLQRITIMPHILFGQIFLLLFIWRFSDKLPRPALSACPESNRREVEGLLRWIAWGILGFIVGIVFPPTLVVVYTVFLVLSVLEVLSNKLPKSLRSLKEWLKEKGLPRIVFILLSFPSLIYLQLMFKVLPWSALVLFDVQHRIPLPYKEYFLALGPMLPLGILGGLIALYKREKIFLPVISWIIGVFLLFAIFEKVPTQSPLRFTEAAIQIPLGILAVYLLSHLSNLGYLRKAVWGLIFTIVVVGFSVMVSMVGWLTDQAYSKGKGTWLVPIGAQLVYPLKDFMGGIYYLRDNTKVEEVVLSYITAGNYIPAYAGNFVYIGHANTPDEDGKEKIAARFFSGKMGQEEAKEFLKKERISYVFVGPQEKGIGGVKDLVPVYPFIIPVYNNSQVTLYKFSI